MGVEAVVNPAGLAAYVYDPQRDVIHFVTSGGAVEDWSVSQKTFVGTTLNVGGTPGSADVTADGAYLLIGNRTPIQTSAPGAPQPTYVDDITRVNLTTHAVDHLQFSINYGGLERGVAHIAVAADGTALVSTDFGGSGFTPIREFSAEGASPTFSVVSGLGSTAESSYLTASDTRQHILVGDSNISDGPLHLFASGSDSVIANNDLYNLGTSGFNFGEMSYNEARGWAIDLGYNNLFVLDSHLALVKDLSSLQHAGAIRGAVVDTDGAHLFLAQSSGQILVLDTSTWEAVGTMTTQSASGQFFGAPVGQMSVISGGKALMLGTASGVEIIDLTQSLHINAVGDATDQVLNGAIGADSLNGGAGNDTLRGGDGGADTLDGGAGNDFISAGRGACVLHGDDGADTLVAVYNNADVNGGAGDDLIRLDGLYTSDPLHLTRLDGGGGNDSFVVYAFPGQALAIDGGTGQNSLEMHYFGTGVEPLLLRLNGDTSGGAWVGVGLQKVTVVSHVANVVGSDASESITAPGVIAGGAGDDVLTGSDPQAAGLNSVTMALTGADTINGGLGNDTINGLSGQSYLRGDEGDDSIAGGSAFDDANGNMGNDTIHGNGGDDFSVGGKDTDLLFGDDGNDIVWGNLGNDTCDGGNGDDQCRGGQGDDSVSGGAGNDFVSGDRGNDTESGGAGADIFHGSQDAGIDRVLDFHLAEGDRVQLDPGTTFTVSQVGADTVIDMGNGNQMILVGVQMTTLTSGWIFGA